VHGIEINLDTYKLLVNNVAVYNLRNVKLYHDNYLTIMHNITQDIVFIDPPWGGLNYKSHEKMMIYLGEQPIWQIVNNLKGYAKLVVLKLPLNFDVDEFKKQVPEKITYNRLNKLLLLLITL
jgi:16S rRNA G966 N2-methylase RsmD